MAGSQIVRFMAVPAFRGQTKVTRDYTPSRCFPLMRGIGSNSRANEVELLNSQRRNEFHSIVKRDYEMASCNVPD